MENPSLTETWQDLILMVQKLGLRHFVNHPTIVFDRRVRRTGQVTSKNEVGVGIAIAINTSRGPELMIVSSADSFPETHQGVPCTSAAEMFQAHQRIARTYGPGLFGTAVEYTQSSNHGLTNTAHLNKPVFLSNAARQLAATQDLTNPDPRQLLQVQQRVTTLGATGHDVRHANHVLSPNDYSEVALPVLAAAGANGTKVWHAKQDEWGKVVWTFNDGQTATTIPTFLAFSGIKLRMPGDASPLELNEIQPDYSIGPNMLLALGMLGTETNPTEAMLPLSVRKANQVLEDRDTKPLLDDTPAGVSDTHQMLAEVLGQSTTRTSYHST